MKKMISIILAGSFLLIINTAKAQTFADYRKMSVEQKTQLVSDSLKANLNLTDNQYKQVEALVTDAINQVAPIVKGPGDRMEKGHKVRAILQASEVKLKAILTPEQRVIFDDKKAKLIAYYRHKLASQPLLFNAPVQ